MNSGIALEISNSQRPSREIDIIFLNKKNYYNIKDTVQGSVRVKPRRDIKFSKILVDISLCEELSSKAERTSLKDISLNLDSLSSSSYPPNLILKKGVAYNFAFKVVIPETLPSTACHARNTLHSRLPPPIDYGPSKTSKYVSKDLKIRLYYVVRACIVDFEKNCLLFNQSGIVLRVMQYPFLNIYDKSIPFKNVTVIKAGRILKSKKGTLELRVSKVPLLYITPSKISTFNVELLYSTENYDSNADFAFIPFQVLFISYRLVSVTALSSTQCNEFDEFNDTTPDQTFSEILDFKKYNHPRLKWIKNKNNELTTAATLPISFPSHASPIPTFDSCHVSRQYRLIVETTLENNVASLKIPLIVLT